MPSIIFLLILTLIITLCSVQAMNVTDIRECPSLTARTTPTSVHDLRPDDIKVIGALGDSITAGAFIMGYNVSTFRDVFQEFRGLSYSGGGGDGAFTFPNYIKHYQPSLMGYSDGNHTLEKSIDIPTIDVCNAAQSGAIAKHLDHQVRYLIERMRALEGIDFNNDWKMINLQIGSNDMCAACTTEQKKYVTVKAFGRYVEAAVDRIQANIPKVIVNLSGTYNVSQVFPLTEKKGKEYCKPIPAIYNHIISNRDECPCSKTEKGMRTLEKLFVDYNKKLFEIYEKRQKKKSETFALIYQQSNLNFPQFPVEFFSNFDCYHPSLEGHKWLSKLSWNQLFIPQAQKPKIFNFDFQEPIYCPNDSDRIATS